MERFFAATLRRRYWLLGLFAVAFAVCLVLKGQVSVNYQIEDYLPPDSPSTKATEVMREEFREGIPSVRVMLREVSLPRALAVKNRLAALPGVRQVTFLDDSVSLTLPEEALPAKTVEQWYRQGNALLLVTLEEGQTHAAVPAIRAVVGETAAMTGSAVSTAVATESTLAEIRVIALFSVLFVLAVLCLTMRSFAEPLLVLAGIGVAVVLNAGTHLVFGEISFVTNAAGSILQLAVSLDYSVFLLHRFEECRSQCPTPAAAMARALRMSASSVTASGVTTVIGFLALAFMRFRIGPDLGLALAKGVAISLLTVFFFLPSLVLLCAPLVDRTRHRPFVPSFTRFGRLVRRLALPMALAFAVVIAPAFLASGANSFYYGASHIFGPETALGQDTAAIEETFGAGDTYVLMVPRGNRAAEGRLSQALRALPHVTGLLSYVDSVGAQIPTGALPQQTLARLESEHYTRFVLSVDLPYEGEETERLVGAVRSAAEVEYPGGWYLAGQGVSTCDLKETVTADMLKVNLLAVGAIFAVLVATLRSLLPPVLLVLCIETAIWLNLAVPYFTGQPIFYLAYLIISSVQLGATVDYAILLTGRYTENRARLPKGEAAAKTVADVTASILTSGSALTVVGLLLGRLSTNQLLAQIGQLIGRGALFSLALVLLVLPGLLMLLDRLVIGRRGAGLHRPGKESNAQ